MKSLSALVLLTALAAPAAAQNQTTFRNEKGQTTGTATTDSNATKMSSPILKRAKVSRPSGQWRDDDYDVSYQAGTWDQAAEGYRQGRVASRRTLSPRRLHRDGT